MTKGLEDFSGSYAELHSHQIAQNKRHDREMKRWSKEYTHTIDFFGEFFDLSFWGRLRWLFTGRFRK